LHKFKSFFCPSRILYEAAIQLKGDKHYLRNVSHIRPEWLLELAPKYYEHARAVCPELNQRILSSLGNDANGTGLLNC
jgi:hypothetical protein